MLFFKTEGDTTTAMQSIPSQLTVAPIVSAPAEFHVGPYVINADVLEGTSVKLSTSKAVIADVKESAWGTIENPPAVFYSSSSAEGIYIFYLRSRHRQAVRVPDPSSAVIAVTPISNGFRVAYVAAGQCGIDPRSIGPNAFAARLPSNLCFVDVPDESRIGDSARAPSH